MRFWLLILALATSACIDDTPDSITVERGTIEELYTRYRAAVQAAEEAGADAEAAHKEVSRLQQSKNCT